MKTYRDLVAEAKRAVPEVTVEDVHARLGRGEALALVDVRDPDEFREGAVAGAVPISRGFLEFKVPEAFPDADTPLVLYCLSGLRSLLAGKVLHDLGYTNVSSMAGGIRRWKELKLPLVKDEPLTPEQMERYSRHFMLTSVGEKGQKRLLRSKVLSSAPAGWVRRRGSTSPPPAWGSSASSTTTSSTCRTSSARFSTGPPDVGRPKVESARDTIHGAEPRRDGGPYAERLTVDNIERIIKDYDVIVDGSDNFPTRYLVNDACYLPASRTSTARSSGSRAW